MSKYFSEKEFQRCSPSCSMSDMDGDFLGLLDKIREDAGIPLVLTSAFRSVAWELSNGRSGKGAHTKGLAVDIKCTWSGNRYKIVQSAIKHGIRRIGIGKTFIHLDNDPSLPQGVMWDYYN